ncbi:hypothetical protein HK103_007201 [Boothiomyces macroporosus]|uniref:V-type proton ATPase subunit C n=1 Tax=Boothiomyces macroporosus TaxID=261099 RepID=A0AAD5UCG1_9FUNG|nr:hypothetical protein HK103_007201 [Boothiomyces macroporosus]
MSSQPATQWFISAPANPTKQDTIAKLKERLSKHDYAEIFPFNIPEFKVVGVNPDSLMVLSDELAKNDTVIEAAVVKIADSLKTLLNNDIEQWKQMLNVGDKNVALYLESFSWNTMKYRSDKTLKELADNILNEVNSIDAVMKTKLQAYGVTKATLQGLQRKTTGNLLVKSLNDIVKKEHFVLDSEYLITLVVAVPKNSMKEWVDQYETITDMVVPRSTVKIAEDDEYALFTVTLFQRIVDEFTAKAREKKFIVRDFKWNPELLSDEKKKYQEIVATEKEQWSKPKQERKVRDLLNKHYAYIDKSGGATEEVIDEALQTLIGDKDYSPVVLFALNPII